MIIVITDGGKLTTMSGVQPEEGRNDNTHGWKLTVMRGVQPELHVVQTLIQEQQSGLFFYFKHNNIKRDSVIQLHVGY